MFWRVFGSGCVVAVEVAVKVKLREVEVEKTRHVKWECGWL